MGLGYVAFDLALYEIVGYNTDGWHLFGMSYNTTHVTFVLDDVVAVVCVPTLPDGSYAKLRLCPSVLIGEKESDCEGVRERLWTGGMYEDAITAGVPTEILQRSERSSHGPEKG